MVKSMHTASPVKKTMTSAEIALSGSRRVLSPAKTAITSPSKLSMVATLQETLQDTRKHSPTKRKLDIGSPRKRCSPTKSKLKVAEMSEPCSSFNSLEEVQRILRLRMSQKGHPPVISGYDKEHK